MPKQSVGEEIRKERSRKASDEEIRRGQGDKKEFFCSELAQRLVCS